MMAWGSYAPQKACLSSSKRSADCSVRDFNLSAVSKLMQPE